MRLKKTLYLFVSIFLLLFSVYAVNLSGREAAPPADYAVSQAFIDFASPVYLTANLEYRVTENQSGADVTDIFLKNTNRYYKTNDWTSIHHYLAVNGYTIVRCDALDAQPYSDEVVIQVSGWPIIAAESGNDVPAERKIYYNAEAKISGAFAYNPNTGKIVSVTDAIYSNFKFYPTFTSVDAEVNVVGLAPFSSHSNYVAYFGCTFRLAHTLNISPSIFYLVDSNTGSSSLRLSVEGCPA